ncbi:MAG: hypothetical protein U1E14_16775 [Geminicoccaceae bacterium]
MAGPDLDGALIAAIGNFTITVVSPLTVGPLAVAAWFWQGARVLRPVGAGLGMLLAIPELVNETNLWRGAGALLGSIAAGMLWAEVLLTLVIPLLRTISGVWSRLTARGRPPR